MPQAKPNRKHKEVKNQKEMVIWTAILAVLLLIAAGLLWKMRAADSSIHIPETAFEKKTVARPREGLAEDSAASRFSPSTLSSNGARPEVPPSNELKRAMELVDQGHWDEAEPILLAELAKDPKNESVLLELAMIQILDKHQPQAAVPYLETAIRVNPTNDAAIEELLGVYEEGQNWDQAVRFFESIPDGEGHGYVDYGRGTALLSAGRNAEAADLLRKSVYEEDNKNFTARESLATALESTGKLEDAAHEYEQVIQSGSYKPEQVRIAKIRLANTYALEKNYAQARALLEPLVEADPKDRWAARVLEQLDRKESR